MLPTIFENRPAASTTMAYSPSTPTIDSITYYTSSEECLVCPSRPRRRKMKATVDGIHMLIPLPSDGKMMVPMADFPPLPFDFAKTDNNIMKMVDDNDITSDDLVVADRPVTSMMKPTSTPPPKLPLQRKQSLTHINRRRRSIGARCA